MNKQQLTFFSHCKEERQSLPPGGKQSNSSLLGGGQKGANTHFIEPLEYLPFVYLMSQSYLVLTDSGGIQEEILRSEAESRVLGRLGKPVLVMCDTTERPEAVDAGTVKLVGTDKEKMIKEVKKLIIDINHYNSVAKANNPYGGGQAWRQIVKTLN